MKYCEDCKARTDAGEAEVKEIKQPGDMYADYQEDFIISQVTICLRFVDVNQRKPIEFDALHFVFRVQINARLEEITSAPDNDSKYAAMVHVMYDSAKVCFHLLYLHGDCIILYTYYITEVH